jgi:hypothetical protein
MIHFSNDLPTFVTSYMQKSNVLLCLKGQGSAQDCWSACIFSTKFKQISGFFAEWWSGPTSADWQGQNTERSVKNDFMSRDCHQPSFGLS